MAPKSSYLGELQIDDFLAVSIPGVMTSVLELRIKQSLREMGVEGSVVGQAIEAGRVLLEWAILIYSHRSGDCAKLTGGAVSHIVPEATLCPPPVLPN